MKTKIVQLELKDRDKLSKQVDEAAQIIKKGGIVAMPSETCYALAVDASNQEAVEKLFKIKERPKDKPVPVVVADIRMIQDYAILNEIGENIVRNFMPGPVTIVLEKKPTTPDVLSIDGVAIRVAGHPFARYVSQESEAPLTATSANISGEDPIYSADLLVKNFSGKVDMIVVFGNLPPIIPSTMVDVRKNPPVLIRQGPVSFSEIMSQLKRSNLLK
jgi:L-threonylcarbamoyladenylate synthase